LSELLEKYYSIISSDLMNISKNLDGNLKDIGSGTRIKIPTDVGYVNFFKSQNSFEITCWMKLEIQERLEKVIKSKVGGALS